MDNNSVPLVGYEAGVLAGATYPPFGVKSVIELSGRLQISHLAELSYRLAADPTLIKHISPPTVLFSMADDGRLRIANDYRALGQCYEHIKDGFSAWSNVIAFPLLFAMTPPVEDEEAAGLRALLSFYPRSLTPFRNVRRIPGATLIEAIDRADPPKAVNQDTLIAILEEAYRESFSAEKACQTFLSELEQHIAEATSYYDGDFVLDLSGGLDSRLLLAGLITLDRHQCCSYRTFANMARDVDLTRAVVDSVRKAGIPLDWRLEPMPAAHYSCTNNSEALEFLPVLRDFEQPRRNDLVDRFLFIFHFTNGHVMPGGYYQAPSIEIARRIGSVTLRGLSGETLRAAKYRACDIEKGRESFIRYYEKKTFERTRLGSKIPPRMLYREATLNAGRDVWRGYFEEARGYGFTDFRMFDLYGIAGQQSRRIATGTEMSWITPLDRPALLATAFSQRDVMRTQGEFHTFIINELCPFMKDVPYTSQVRIPPEEIRRDMQHYPSIDDEGGVQGFRELLDQPELWDDAYDPEVVRKVYVEKLGQINAYQRDKRAAQLAWRAAHKL